MCAMTDMGVRMKRAIDGPGLWLVFGPSIERTGQRFMRILDEPQSRAYAKSAYKPLYMVRLRLRDWGVPA